jgi:hypothetical protein
VRGVSGATGGFRMGARGGAGTGGSPVRESMCESEKRTRCSALRALSGYERV